MDADHLQLRGTGRRRSHRRLPGRAVVCCRHCTVRFPSQPPPGRRPYRVPPGRTGVMTMAAGPKETACGVVFLRRHCPDQVPGGRRSASELSPASQPFLPAPGPPGTPFGPAPSITSQTVFTLHAADGGRLGPKARPARAKRRVSPKACGLAGRQRSYFQVLPLRPFTGGGRGRACRESNVLLHDHRQAPGPADAAQRLSEKTLQKSAFLQSGRDRLFRGPGM
jgi:hypothetical protein